MPKCPWCGKEYPAGQQVCPTDGNPLITPEKAMAPARQPVSKSDWRPELMDLGEVIGAFSFEEGFSRPDWRVISKAIQQRISGPADLNIAWTEAARQWVLQLQSDLGGGYQVKDSPQFILLSALDEESSKNILVFAERTLDQIQERLKDAAWKPGCGKHVILLFAEEDDYYQYVSYFHREGNHPASGGCLISAGGYVHIAAPYKPSWFRPMLAHELTHNCLVHLRLPLWLDEGLAVMFERTVTTTRYPILDGELKDRHLTFWNAETIQEFWSGVSFRKPGESNTLSYSLAEVILTLLLERGGDWSAFVKEAQWADAGQTAAIECLAVDLGSVMSTFLGEGDWRPRRRAMVTLWESEKKARSKQSETG